MSEALNEIDATEAAARLADGSATSRALVTACLGRIAERDGEIGAWAHLEPAHALGQACMSDAAGSGPLRGIPVGIKDIFDTADLPTEYGSPIHRGHRPARDSACVAALRRAGAVILGKATTTEFASPVPVGVKNPRDFARSPGVSSSGSAAAVADFMVPVTLGSQTGGSMIMPAASCGVVGYKASLDGIDRGGLRHVRASLDTIGIFARSPRDIALVRAAMTEAPPVSFDEAPGALRVAVCRAPNWEDAEPATVEAVDAAEAALDRAGARVTGIDLPPVFDAVEDAFRIVTAVEGGRSLAWEIAGHRDRLNHWIRDQVAIGEGASDADYAAAQETAARCRAAMAGIFDRFDFVLTASAPGEPSDDLTGIQKSSFNRVWTLMHGPCITIPAFAGPNGLPVGVQLVGPIGADDRLIRLADWVWRAIEAR
ncbi:MAG: amidase [Defluviicoccus sp.]|nr:amidase [Defluviicoccus sp.]MDE0383105.1 amidase [Defluviicoccus sp.]